MKSLFCVYVIENLLDIDLIDEIFINYDTEEVKR